MPCAVMLVFASLSTDFPCELVHNFVSTNVFCFDFGSFFLFIMLNRVWWLAKLVACQLFMSAACFAGRTQLKGVLSCCLALAVLMGGLILKHMERTYRGGTSRTPLSGGALPTPRVPATQAVGDGRDRPALILIPVVCCIFGGCFLEVELGSA